jgi:hypothetical protein
MLFSLSNTFIMLFSLSNTFIFQENKYTFARNHTIRRVLQEELVVLPETLLMKHSYAIEARRRTPCTIWPPPFLLSTPPPHTPFPLLLLRTALAFCMCPFRSSNLPYLLCTRVKCKQEGKCPPYITAKIITLLSIPFLLASASNFEVLVRLLMYYL